MVLKSTGRVSLHGCHGPSRHTWRSQDVPRGWWVLVALPRTESPQWFKSLLEAASCPLQCPVSPHLSLGPKRSKRVTGSHVAESCSVLQFFPAACMFSLVLWLRAALPLLFTRRVQAFQASSHHLLHQNQQLSPVRTRTGDHPSAHPSTSDPFGVRLSSAVGVRVCY